MKADRQRPASWILLPVLPMQAVLRVDKNNRAAPRAVAHGRRALGQATGGDKLVVRAVTHWCRPHWPALATRFDQVAVRPLDVLVAGERQRDNLTSASLARTSGTLPPAAGGSADTSGRRRAVTRR